MENLQTLLQLSAKLYQSLETIPDGEERDEFIKDIDSLLDERGDVLAILRKEGFIINPKNQVHNMLIELDQGIRKRLDVVMQAVKLDMKNLQNSKKSEKQYNNPYSSVRVMDGMYYDKKK